MVLLPGHAALSRNHVGLSVVLLWSMGVLASVCLMLTVTQHTVWARPRHCMCDHEPCFFSCLHAYAALCSTDRCLSVPVTMPWVVSYLGVDVLFQRFH